MVPKRVARGKGKDGPVGKFHPNFMLRHIWAPEPPAGIFLGTKWGQALNRCPAQRVGFGTKDFGCNDGAGQGGIGLQVHRLQIR